MAALTVSASYDDALSRHEGSLPVYLGSRSLKFRVQQYQMSFFWSCGDIVPGVDFLKFAQWRIVER